MRKGEITKRKIYNTSVELFNEKGYSNVTIDEITKKCGISKGNFYTHYNSKSDVLAEQFIIIDDLYSSFYNDTLENDLDSLEKFLNHVFYIVEHNVGKEMLKNLYSENMLQGGMQSLYSNTRDLYIVLEKILSGSDFDTFNKEDILQACIVIIRGVCSEWALSPKNIGIDKYYKNIVTAYINNLRANSNIVK